MRCSQPCGTKRHARAIARRALALAWVIAASAHAGAAVPPEPATDRVLIKFRDAQTVPRAATASSTPDRERQRIDALSVRRATPMQYVRTIYNGAHSVFLGRWMHGSELTALVAQLAADPEVEMVAPDRRKRAFIVPNDPRYGANDGDATGAYTQQWYLLPPTATLVSPINAEAAWDLSKGSASVAVAIVDTGVLFSHPDLGSVANGGKLLPGYDLVGCDNARATLPCTFYVANDGNGRDPDPTDAGDWINTTDQTAPAPGPESLLTPGQSL